METHDYFPHADADLNSWTTVFDTGLNTYAATLGLSAAEAAALNTATKNIRTALAAANQAQAVAKQAVADKNAVVKASEGVIRPLVRHAKTSSTYTPAIGQALQVIGTDVATDWATYKPVITAATFPGHVTIGFKKLGAQGVNIYARLKGESAWQKLAFDGHSPYIDNRPGATTPGASENREYMAIGVLRDAEVGQQSDIVSITFAG